MQRKLALLSFITAATFFAACSDEPTNANPIDPNGGIQDSIPVVNPDNPLNQQGDPNQGQGQQNPLSSATGPVNPQSSNAQLGISSTTQPGISSSSALIIAMSSSVGLKEYDDNHKAKATFLPKAGFYSNLTIEPPTPTKGGEIKCTFDGSFPTQGSQAITSAMQITKNTVVRCSEFVNGQPADTTTQTYFIGENVSMPVVALTVNHHDMFDSTDGLYATGPMNQLRCNNPNFNQMSMGVNLSDNNNSKCAEPCFKANFWCEDSLPVHVEYFEKGSSTTEKTWEIDAGISLIGNWSRYKPKKSVAIKMDNDEWGDKVLKYSFFKTRPEAKKMKSFNLRNNGNRFWTDYIGDAMMTSLMEGTDVDYQRSLQVVVFYNGEYFGIHDLRERLNRSFVETNYGIDSKSINMINIKGNSAEASGTKGASADEYKNIANQIINGNFAGDNNQSYEQMKQKVNMNSFAQYMLAEFYFHNGDWPENNIRAWGGNGNPFKFVAFDTDHGFGFSPGISGFDVTSQNMFQWALGSATRDNSQQGGQQQPGQGQFPGMGGWDIGGGWGFGGAKQGPAQMLNKLLDNNDFKRLFINNACILLDNYLTYENVQKKVQEMMAAIPASEQQRDQQRWPRNQGSFHWSPDGSDLIQYAQNRTQTVRQEMEQYFGLQNAVNVSINVSGSGSVTVDGMKLPKSNYQGKFYAGNDLLLQAVPSNGSVFTGWSDGSTENPRKFTPNGQPITAQFK
ncbi:MULTISPECIES: CotH kinase family protein [unclassified Fibrobacter]|uniref:CotH kinase family protein n=1 Tax=unclassified Fibrobacter TaxID=2634177 RepID=UPI0025C14B7C|nr:MULTISPECIES: CotH kinase family protein [unclassified Fibrobacter]